MEESADKMTAGQKIAQAELRIRFWKAVALCAGHNKLSANEVEKMVLYSADQTVSEAQVNQYMALAKQIAAGAKG